MNIQDLLYFNKLVELRNYSQTARYFSVTQPTISYTIKRLEKKFGTTLLDRQTMNLTIAGKQFYEHTQKITHEMDLLSKDMAGVLTPRIKLGLPPIITNYLLHQPKYLKVFQANLEHLTVYSEESQHTFQDLIKGNLDVSLVGSAQPIVEPDLNADILCQHHFKIICSSRSPLANNKEVSLAELQEYPFILLDKKSTHQQVFSQLMSRHLFNPQVLFCTANFNTILTLVQQNSGISFLTETALAACSHDIVALDLKEAKQIYFYISLVSRVNHEQNPILQAFIQQIKSAIN
ncbi:LysR family transcriptional regulator [Bombilactobacillus bombi]|uniref:LysR family transcriptional regulator n=1 Tax=Bombilactobacillus bombi TaxID=1303590 RepID=UPI0035E8CDD7